MEASCREAPWPCAVLNAAPAQNTPAKIVCAAVRFFALPIWRKCGHRRSPHFRLLPEAARLAQERERHRAGSCRFIKVDFAPLGVSDLARSRRSQDSELEREPTDPLLIALIDVRAGCPVPAILGRLHTE